MTQVLRLSSDINSLLGELQRIAAVSKLFLQCDATMIVLKMTYIYWCHSQYDMVSNTMYFVFSVGL